jgi:CRISPR-associated protein Cas1
LDLQNLLGLEGSAARVYFQQLFGRESWHGRKPRAKQDPTNTLLDIGYTLLFNFVEGLLNLYGFDLYRGVYHQQFYQRKSLVCDLVEPFRPIIDSRIRKAFSLGQVNVEDFDVIQGQYRLFGEKSRSYLKWLLEEILTHKQGMFLYTQQYYRCFMRQKPVDEYPLFNKFLNEKC